MAAMAVAIAVRVRLLARLRELAGVDAAELKVAPGSRAADVYDALRAAHTGLPAAEGVRAAVNHEFVDWDAAVDEGDEIAFIPPVSGGA